jgi:hypothetical protein
MISLELITKYNSVLDKCQLDKTELIEIVNLLKEFKTIQFEVSKIQRKVIELIKSGTISKYIELDSKLYCLETGNTYHPISLDQATAKELIELEDKIDDAVNKLDNLIDLEQGQIDNLFIKKEEYIEKLSSEIIETKAVNCDGYLLVNTENKFYEIIPN